MLRRGSMLTAIPFNNHTYLSFFNKSSSSPGSRFPTLAMIPVITEDVVEALATAQNIHKIAFRNADTTS
jgi:hypothetical protein